MTNLDIARAVTPEDIVDLARQRLGIAPQFIEPWGHHKAKLSEKLAPQLADSADGKLILVSAMTPTPAGEGKTTTTIGVADALAGLGKKTMICLRQPSMGPAFGVKGGATGGGRAQIIPMEDINLHFTGDFHAVCAANNLLAAMVDNHIHHGNKLGIDTRRVTWKRVIDLNDRALRNITIGLGGRRTANRGKTASISRQPRKSWQSFAWPNRWTSCGSVSGKSSSAMTSTANPCSRAIWMLTAR